MTILQNIQNLINQIFDDKMLTRFRTFIRLILYS